MIRKRHSLRLLLTWAENWRLDANKVGEEFKADYNGNTDYEHKDKVFRIVYYLTDARVTELS
ncbi:MAG: hypothetical protein R3A12_19870 [Ignavibacteria bacterium]